VDDPCVTCKDNFAFAFPKEIRQQKLNHFLSPRNLEVNLSGKQHQRRQHQQQQQQPKERKIIQSD